MLLLSEEGVGVGVGYLITQPLLTHEFVHAISHTFSAKNEELALGQIERNNQDPTELPRKRKLVWGGKVYCHWSLQGRLFPGFSPGRPCIGRLSSFHFIPSSLTT